MDPSIQGGLRTAARHLEIAAVFAGLIVFSQALKVFFGAESPEDEQLILRLLWYPVYLVAIIGLAARPRAALRYGLASALILPPLAMVALSTQWSIDPDITFRRAIALICSTLFAIYLAARFDWRDLLVMLCVLFGVLAAACLVTALVFPSVGIMSETHPGAWRGLWGEKNEMGAQMARGALIFAGAAALFPDLRRRAWIWGGLALCAGLVLMSTSKTSLIALLLIPASLFAIHTLRRGAVSALTLICVGGLGAVIVGGLMIWNLDMFFELLGRERSLTGRTDIWAALADSIAQRPWFGYGYGVFWLDRLGPAYWVRQATEWLVPTAHNGWLETALSIGLVGLALTTLYMLGAIGTGAAQIWRRREALISLPFILLSLIFTFSESVILQHNNLAWLLFVVMAAKQFAPDGARRDRFAPLAALGARGPARRSGYAPERTTQVIDWNGEPAEPARAAGAGVSPLLTLCRVPLRPGASMIDLSADLADLAASLDRTRPADGRGRVVMFTAPRARAGVSLVAREFSRLMARRAPRGVWLFDLDFSRNDQFRAFTTTEARQRYGPIGQALDATLGEDPFWRLVQTGKDDDRSSGANASSLLTLHRVGGTRLFVSHFHPELLGRGRRLHVRAAHAYWEKLRDTVELAVIDAPSPERSFAGRALYGEADAVVMVVDETDESLDEAELLAETIRDRGGLPAGVIVNFTDAGAAERQAG